MKKLLEGIFIIIVFFAVAFLIIPSKASAHCDSLNGPVVNAARKALSTENVNYVLIWIKPEKEAEIKKALERARKKRKSAKTKEEKEKAEMEFFELLVRAHREGEGAKYEGIKSSGSLEPEIAIADKAIKTGELDDVINHIKSSKNKEIISHLFNKLQEKSDYSVDDISAGREYVDKYIVFIHAVEKAIKGNNLHEDKLHEH